MKYKEFYGDENVGWFHKNIADSIKDGMSVYALDKCDLEVYNLGMLTILGLIEMHENYLKDKDRYYFFTRVEAVEVVGGLEDEF